ncbi:zinc finger BED domain-containing protein 4-like [Neodiprion pinetum]|uniref:zinc finger BED domain-containing protein 4-like n=1 Tax=Neodiprion pinetum TaxID=441929 RepID=UPI001EE049BC|nr:zinc finger BED domain-containing protein 4-like [Neodiprion pinetum]
MIKAIDNVFDSDVDNLSNGNIDQSKKNNNKRLPCFAHRASHIVPKAIAKMPHIQLVIDKVKRIVMMTRKSVPAADELRRLQERDGKSEGTILKFIQSVDTRWTSTYDMLERFLLLEDYVYPVTSKCANPPPMLSHEVILKDIVNLIKPVMIIITELSGDSYLTCSIIIPAVAVMKNEIMLSKPKTEDGVQFKNHLLNSLDNQFYDIESYPTLAIATILDPRFKTLHFQRAMHAADAVEHIRKRMNSSITQTSTSISVSSTVNFEAQLNKNNIWRHHDQLVAKTSAATYSLDGVAFELKQYLTQPVIPRNEDPLKYWQLLKPSFPSLFQIAMKYFCVVGTSVPCERLFSEAGNIKTDDRNRLTGKNLDKLLFLSSLTSEDWGY